MQYLDLKLHALDEHGDKKEFKLSDFKGKNIVLYFYPKDETPICTEEAVKFNEALDKFPKDTVVIGVSADDVESHLNFMEKLGLKFKLLSDKEHKLKAAIEDFVKRNFKYDKLAERATVIINKDGHIAKAWCDVDVNGHVEEIIEYLNNQG